MAWIVCMLGRGGGQDEQEDRTMLQWKEREMLKESLRFIRKVLSTLDPLASHLG